MRELDGGARWNEKKKMLAYTKRDTRHNTLAVLSLSLPVYAPRVLGLGPPGPTTLLTFAACMGYWWEGWLGGEGVWCRLGLRKSG